MVYFREDVVRDICRKEGDVQEIRFSDEEGIPYEDIVRVRMIMDLKMLFHPAIRLTHEDRWILLKYEKLNYVCKFCGLITLGEEECPIPYPLPKTPPTLLRWALMRILDIWEGGGHYPFGEWMCCGRYRRETALEWIEHCD